MMTKDTGLTIEIADDELVIRIGVATLAYAADQSEHAQEQCGGFRVTDAAEFARDVMHGLSADYQLDAGCSIFERMMDKTFAAVVNDGSLGVTPIEDNADD